MTNHKPGEQRADAHAQRDFDASDGKGHENADDASEENRQSQHDEVDTCAGSHVGADLRHRLFYDGFGADDAKQIAALQHDAGRDGDFLTAATHPS